MLDRLDASIQRTNRLIQFFGPGEAGYYAKLIKELAVGMAFISEAGTLTGLNRVCAVGFGWRPEQVLGQHMNVLIPNLNMGKLLSNLFDRGIGARSSIFLEINEIRYRLALTVCPTWEAPGREVALLAIPLRGPCVVIAAEEASAFLYAYLLHRAHYQIRWAHDEWALVEVLRGVGDALSVLVVAHRRYRIPKWSLGGEAREKNQQARVVHIVSKEESFDAPTGEIVLLEAQVAQLGPVVDNLLLEMEMRD